MTGSGSSGARTTRASAPVAADRAVRRAAVLGSPISHSLSPALHLAAYRALGLHGWSYTAIEMTAAAFPEFVVGLDESWCGLSLTMPLKEVALARADDVTDLARTARSVNTFVRRADGSWLGDNTDIAGIVSALEGIDHGGRARVLGAGATARSALLALRSLRVTGVDVAARRPEAATDLVELAESLGLHARAVPLSEWWSDAPPLIVSTLPGSAGPALARAASPMDGVTLFDVVYVPWPSPLAAGVEAAGGRTVSGLEMLIHQAARQVELFTGRRADVEAMRAAVAPPL